MPKYWKKLVALEAFQMTASARYDNRDWPEWLNAAWQKEPGEQGALYWDFDPERKERRLLINTLEGAHLVSLDDWIIQGVRGEVYPCKPDIFAATYEEVG